jgi:hypothetical protein
MKRLTILTAAVALSAMVAAACAAGAGSLGPGPTAPSASSTTPTSPTPGSPSPSTTPARLFTFQVWLTRGGKLFETKRTEPFNIAVGKLALDALQKGPTDTESSMGIGTDIRTGANFRITALSRGVATVESGPNPCCLKTSPGLGEGQVVFTLTQFPNIRKVRFPGDDNATFGRADLESLMPAITVDSPTIGQQVSSPVTVSGTANVFEATVNVRILDAHGRELARTFTTATCGTGCRGDYSVRVSYKSDHQQSGTVEVLDYSAQDGSPRDVVDIPVILSASNDPPAQAAIVVESPKPGDVVPNPVTVSGTANVFEAQFNLRILDRNGKILTEVPVHASCGTGCRGTFSIKVGYHVTSRQRGSIWVFDYSPKDGSIIDLVKIPVTLTP